MPAPITRTLGQFVADLRYDDLPPLAIEAVKAATIDGIAVMIDAFDMDFPKYFHSTLTTRGACSEARIYLGTERASVNEAAYINAITMTAHDIDDVAFRRCHTTAVMLPAILAEADVINASGRDIITAYAAGYEAWARVLDYDKDQYPDLGWHATTAWGVIGSAAAIAWLHRLDAEKTTTAIAIAASLSGGLTGSLAHPTRLMQGGRAASNGIDAVRLAKAGMTAPLDALEHKGGLLSALSPRGNYDIEKPIDDLFKQWRLESVGVSLKQYPFFNNCQRTLDAMFDLIRDHDLKPEQIESVAVIMGAEQARVRDLLRPHDEFYFSEGDLSLAVAAALFSRHSEGRYAQLARYVRSETQDLPAEILRLMKRVSIEVRDDAPSDGEVRYLGASGKVVVKLTDGRKLETPYQKYNRAHWKMRLSTEDLWQKFDGCSSRFMPRARSRGLFDALQNLEHVKSVAEISVV